MIETSNQGPESRLYLFSPSSPSSESNPALKEAPNVRHAVVS